MPGASGTPVVFALSSARDVTQPARFHIRHADRAYVLWRLGPASVDKVMLRGARHHAGAIREPLEAKVLVEGPIAVRVRDEPVALRTVATEVVERPVDEALAKAVAARLRADYEQEDARNRAEVRLGAHLLRGADFIEVDGFGGLDVVRVLGALASLSADDLASLREEQKDIEVRCQFCDAVYNFTPEEIAALNAPEEDKKA